VISIKAVDGNVAEVTTRSSSGLDNYYPGHVVSSMQIEGLANLLTNASRLGTKLARPPADVEQSVVLVYLFLDEPCRFPHAWLEINDTDLRAGRITNYAAFNGDMVPEGKACLCVEFFCVGDNPIARLSARRSPRWRSGNAPTTP
jgi:protoporphyrinogen oxidase